MELETSKGNLPLNEVIVRSYDERHNGLTDWVTEYLLLSNKPLTIEELDNILISKGYSVCGEISYRKKELTYKHNDIFTLRYLHICKAKMY